MKEILRSQWNYMLCEKDGDLIFSVVCGTIGLYEINILLNAEEIENFKQKGEEYLKELAEKIRYSPKSFNNRHIELKRLSSMIDSTTIIKLLEDMNPSQYKLLSEVSGLISDNMLKKIAEADYGYKAGECFMELEKIRESKTTPAKVDFGLQEVLELTRWSKPMNKEEHLTRFYSCILLIIFYSDSISCIGDENETLAVFIEDVLELGSNYYQPALQLISWRVLFDYQKELKEVIEDDGDEEDVYLYPTYKYALLLLMIINKEPDELISQMKQWLFNPDEENTRNETENIELLIEIIEAGQRSETWLSISKRIIPNQDIAESENINTALKQLLNYFCN